MEDGARHQIAKLEREAKALGADPAAALLFHQIGLLWEGPLQNARSAAVAYQNAFRLAPKFLANIRAARRLFAEVGNWQMVVQLLDAELAAIAGERERAGLLFEKAAVLEERLSRDEEATQVLSECLKLLPRDVGLLVQLEGAFARRNQYPELVQVYRLLAEEVTDEAARAYYFTGAGLILEARLALPDEAAAAYQAAFKLNRRDPILLAALVRIAGRNGDGDELIGALAAQAQVEVSQAASNYIQISRIYGRLGRHAEALSALLDARSHAPDDPIVLSELAAIYQEQGMHEELAGVLLAQAELSQDPTEFAGLNLRLAALYEEVLKRDDEAVARYRAVLARVPHDADALAGLGRLYHRTQNWEGLLSVCDLEAEAAQEPREKAARMYKAAELLERQLRREDEAIARYNQCLQLQPGYLAAQQALIRLYERQGRYADLVAMYEHDIGLTTERDQIIATLNKMAAIFEEKLDDLDRAIDCMKRILELDPQHVPSIRSLSRMLEYAGQWRELIQVQEREASTCTDIKQILSLHHRNAEILEGQLSDKSGAIEAYRQLLSLSPNYLPALKALGRLYSEQGNWQELGAMYRAEAEIASSPDHAAALLFRAGELIERRLGDSEQAIAVYREVLHLSPSYLPALRALAQIYRSRKDWEQLVEVFRSEAAHRSDPHERAQALFQAAGICEAHLNRLDEAIDAYLEVLRLAPGHAAATAALKRLYTAQGNLQEMVAILDGEARTAESSRAKIIAQLKLADLYLDRLDEPRLAAQACQAILALEPANLQALKMLERACAADGSHSLELKLKLAAAVSDSRLQAALRLAALSNGLADEGTVQKLREQFAEAAPDARPGMLVEAALRRHGKSEELLAHYQRMAQVSAEPLEKLGLLFRLADLAEHQADQPAIALKAYRAALELNPQLVPALQGVARCALKLGDFAAAKEALEAEGNASRDVRSALEAFVAAGRLCAEKLGDSDGAIANFRRALERDPLDPSASAALKDLLSGGKADDLASFHERSAEAKLAQHELSAAAADFLTAARTWLEKSSDPARALRAVERSLAAQPGHAGALEMKGQLALEAHQFGEAAAAYAARVQLGGGAEELIPIHLKLGALYQDYLSDATRAAAHLQTVLAAQPNNPAALERLAAVHINTRNWSGAAESLKALLELEGEPSSRARHSLLLAKVYEEGFSNPALASSLYRRALELAPGDLSIVGRLTDLYERMGNPAELIQVLEQQLQNGAGAQHESALRVKIGNLYTRSLGRPDQAAANYRKALERDPACLEAGVALAELYMHDAAAAPDAIEAHRRVLRLEPTRAESLHALFRLWHGLKQTDRAFCAAAVLRFLGSANEAELAYHKSACNRLEKAVSPLSLGQLNALCRADAKGPILDVLRAVGDQLAKLYPGDFEGLGIQGRVDRVKAEHPAFKTVQAMMRLFGVSTYEAYRMPSGSVTVEIADPFCLCISDDALDKPGREQCALFGRAAFSMANKTPIVNKLALPELADLIGAAIRICVPDFASLGASREELSRQLFKSLSRKARKALEGAVQVIGLRAGDLEHWLKTWSLSEDRAGLIAAGDPYAALSVTLGKEANAAERTGAEPTAADRRRLEELVGFALSEEHFLLREQIGSAL